MKKRLISLFIATAAIISASCGVFYAQNIGKKPAVSQNTTENSFTFSLKTAKSALRLCSLWENEEGLKACLEKKGYENISILHTEPSLKSDNKAGLLLAFKDNTLLCLIRGTKGEEWYSNFYVGEGAQHAGFSKAKDLFAEDIDAYLENLQISKESTEVFISGHSRGAAVGNLLAAELIDSQAFKGVSAYTFACPNTTTLEIAENSRYQSIVNIINPQDFICYIPLPQWGYRRYGVSIELPTYGTENFESLYAQMESSYMADNCTALRTFPHKGKDVENIISYLAYLAPSPRDYYEKEIPVGSFRLSMYDYMMKLAAVMSGENPILHGLFMLSCESVPEVSAITEFVFGTLSEEELKSPKSLEASPVVANHLTPAYEAWLNVLDEEYFTK